MPTIPIQFTDFEVLPMKPGSKVGADTHKIMKDLGYTEEEISALIAEGSVR